MTRFIPSDDRDDEFAWICSEGHWNRRDDERCRRCHESKPEKPELLRELLDKVHREYPREPNDD